MDSKVAQHSAFNTKRLVLSALFIALSLVGSYLKIFGTIAFDSLPAFLASLLLGPIYGAAIGFLGHIFSALSSGFPLTMPIHIVVAAAMAITMIGFGNTYKALNKRLPETANIAVTGIVGTILNGPFSLMLSMAGLAFMSGADAAYGLLALLPFLMLGSVANIVLCFILYKALANIWKSVTKEPK